MMRKTENPRRKLIKDPNVYPPGWNAQKVQEIIEYYDSRKNQPIFDQPEVSKAQDVVWMEIPEDLVTKVQKLIAAKRKSAQRAAALRK